MDATIDSTGDRSSAGSVIERIAVHPPLELDQEELAALLEAAEVIRDADTCLAGRIRILEIDDVVMVQEQTQQGEILVRRVDTVDAANALVDDRLATYERMWDGCGCKVDYGRKP
jgi:hypothetical protein